VAIEHGTRLFRTLLISDVHLGARGCRAERLLDPALPLVGDIVGG